jgi:hypothetical protein
VTKLSCLQLQRQAATQSLTSQSSHCPMA